jgi:hypothetical protein
VRWLSGKGLYRTGTTDSIRRLSLRSATLVLSRLGVETWAWAAAGQPRLRLGDCDYGVQRCRPTSAARGREGPRRALVRREMTRHHRGQWGRLGVARSQTLEGIRCAAIFFAAPPPSTQP